MLGLVNGHICTWAMKFSQYSSLVFIALAGLVALAGSPDSLLVVTLVALGVSSYLFHGSGNEKGTPAHRMDEGSIYVLVLDVVWHSWGSVPWLLLPVGALAAYLLLRLDAVNLFLWLPGLVMAAFAGIWWRAGALVALVALLAVMVAFSVRLLPTTDYRHAIWHLLAALALFVALVAVGIFPILENWLNF